MSKPVTVKFRMYVDDVDRAAMRSRALEMSRSEMLGRLVADGIETLRCATKTKQDRENYARARRREWERKAPQAPV